MDTPDFPLIQNVFVRMFEIHPFDHLLGFSCITGIDAKNGNKTNINGITGAETNVHIAVRLVSIRLRINGNASSYCKR